MACDPLLRGEEDWLMGLSAAEPEPELPLLGEDGAGDVPP